MSGWFGCLPTKKYKLGGILSTMMHDAPLQQFKMIKNQLESAFPQLLTRVLELQEMAVDRNNIYLLVSYCSMAMLLLSKCQHMLNSELRTCLPFSSHQMKAIDKVKSTKTYLWELRQQCTYIFHLWLQHFTDLEKHTCPQELWEKRLFLHIFSCACSSTDCKDTVSVPKALQV